MSLAYIFFMNMLVPVFLVWVAVIIFGLALGSFFSCAAYRIPRGISLWQRQRSFCPHCLTPLTSRELIPVLSYIMQRGRCRSCGRAIGWRYPAIEVITLAAVILLAVLTLF